MTLTRFLSVLDADPDTLEACLDLATRVKADRVLGPSAPTAGVLGGRHVALIFEKPSLRTRATFEVAIRELGGEALLTGPEALGGREPVADVARNLERWVAAAVIRTFAQAKLEAFAAAAPRLRVVNALTDEEHPCQALADVQTLRERFGTDLRGRTLAFLGDGNNVAVSLVHAGAMLGVHTRVCSPEGFDLPDAVAAAGRRVARHGATVRLVRDPRDAVRDADAVYTDVWASMGQESEAAARDAVFRPYQVNAALMAAAPSHAVFMHCLPAHRGDEVTDEVIESPASVVFDQAENRLHSQKALLALLLGKA
jgi:ornithine carbamoyltransferase